MSNGRFFLRERIFFRNANLRNHQSRVHVTAFFLPINLYTVEICLEIYCVMPVVKEHSIKSSTIVMYPTLFNADRRYADRPRYIQSSLDSFAKKTAVTPLSFIDLRDDPTIH